MELNWKSITERHLEKSQKRLEINLWAKEKSQEELENIFN